MNGNSNLQTSWVLKLILLNIAFFMIQALTEGYQVVYQVSHVPEIIRHQTSVMTFYLGLIPAVVAENFYVWQLLSYMFLHGGGVHIFFNMYALLIFGIPIENVWGAKKFLFYYLFTGIGAGLTVFVINYIDKGSGYAVPTIGASGAVYGLLLAFGLLYPDVEILLFFVLPLKAKYLVILYGALEFYLQVSSGGDSNISHIGHLGGLLFGIIYFVMDKRHVFEFRTKKLRSEIKKHLNQKGELDASDGNNVKFLSKMLEKAESGGHASFTDSEIQRIKYIEIMSETKNNLCIADDFISEDEYCKKCDDYVLCALRKLKKYIDN